MKFESTVGDVYDFYQKFPEYVGEVEVSTRWGLQTIEWADITAPNSSVIKITTSSGKMLKTSPEHLLFSGRWTKVKDLNVEDSIETCDGDEIISDIELMNYTEDLYDFQVADVQEYYSNGIVSHNSTLLDSLTFALFDKPFRKISKTKLVNSVNRKGTLVEINFSVGKTKFMIRRGIKPNKFEIYKNEELLDQDGSNKDYQEYLEKNVLKMNFKSFTQVVILGSSTFVPFMELSAPDRRTIVEDLLDIEVFSTMNVLAKGKLSSIKHDHTELQNRVDILKDKLDVQKSFLTTLQNERDERATDNESEIQTLNESTETLESEISKLSEKISLIKAKLTGVDKLKTIRDDIKGITYTANANIATREKTIRFFDGNDTCPTCTQDIDEGFKKDILTRENGGVGEQQKIVDAQNAKMERVVEKLEKVDKALARVREYESEVQTRNSKVSSNNYAVKRLLDDAKKATDTTKIDEVEDKVKEFKTLLKQHIADLAKVSMEVDEYMTVVNLLKDSGIKTQIIKQYLPIMNSHINTYMEKMNFPVAFEIDDEFNEKIRSRYRDEFSYANFSEGEKQRINLSLLLTWRKIAQMRNSASTNLLVLDEVFDSSLDVDGTEGFMSILKGFNDGTNVSVISHKGDVLFERFDNVLEFYKDGNFSQVREKMD